MKTLAIQSINKEIRDKYICIIILCFTILSLCWFSYKKGYIYHEIDSYALPIVSLQYRGSILMNETDLIKAQQDFPHIYKNIDSYEKLRSSKLLVTKSGEWESFYFPIVAIGALPFKLLLTLANKNQEYCFILFNIFCVAYLSIVILLKKEFSLIQKILGIALIHCSPLFLYVRYIGAETVIFSLAGIGVLRIYERKYNRAAIAITIAGMANSTIMVLGMACIIDFIIYTIGKYQERNFLKIILHEIKNIVLLIVCFVPCFSPFILKHKTGVMSFESIATVNGIFDRFLAYIFDINLGFCSFCPILIVLLCIGLFLNIKKKRFRIFIFYFGMLGTILAYSLMYHINCGMLYCARYVFWSYGMLLMIVLLFFADLFITPTYKKIITLIIAASCVIACACFYENKETYTYYLDFHKTTKKILTYLPSLYNPLPSTFNSRVNHIDGGYDYKTPVVYTSEKGYITKILATEKDSDYLKGISSINGTPFLLKKKLSTSPKYISLPVNKKFMYGEKYSFGDVIFFFGAHNNSRAYITTGLSGTEEHFTWTEGHHLDFFAAFEDYEPQKSIHSFIDCGVFNGTQRVNVIVNESQRIELVARDGIPLEFDFEPSDNGKVHIAMDFPDAVSPKSLGMSEDPRVLALALKTITFSK